MSYFVLVKETSNRYSTIRFYSEYNKTTLQKFLNTIKDNENKTALTSIGQCKVQYATNSKLVYNIMEEFANNYNTLRINYLKYMFFNSASMFDKNYSFEKLNTLFNNNKPVVFDKKNHIRFKYELVPDHSKFVESYVNYINSVLKAK